MIVACFVATSAHGAEIEPPPAFTEDSGEVTIFTEKRIGGFPSHPSDKFNNDEFSVAVRESFVAGGAKRVRGALIRTNTWAGSFIAPSDIDSVIAGIDYVLDMKRTWSPFPQAKVTYRLEASDLQIDAQFVEETGSKIRYGITTHGGSAKASAEHLRKLKPLLFEAKKELSTAP